MTEISYGGFLIVHNNRRHMKIIFPQFITNEIKGNFARALFVSRSHETHHVTHAIVTFGKINRDIFTFMSKSSKQSGSSSNAITIVVCMFHTKRSIFDRSDELRKTGTERSVPPRSIFMHV